MKVLPIQHSFAPYNKAKKSKLEKQNGIVQNSKTTNIPECFGKDLIIFRGVNQISLSDKLSYALKQLDVGEFLVVAKDSRCIAEALKSAEGRIKTMIEKLIILEEPEIREVLFFYTTPSGEKELWNANEYPIRRNGFDEIRPDEVVRLEDGDRLKISAKWIDLTETLDDDPDELKKEMDRRLKIQDYSEIAQKTINKHNRKALALLLNPPKENTEKAKNSFAKVGGQDEVIKALKRNILFPLKYPEVFEGFMLSRGTILYGPPGTGKTLLAHALIEESGASAFEQCATEFEAKYVGESEQNCRELFKKAVDAQPSIIFLDEIDALGKSRGKDVHGDKLLNQFLSCMSDLEKNGDKVFVIGATNHETSLDPALTRSGRFDLKLECKAPDLEGVKQIFEIHTKGKPLEEELDIEKIAQKMFAKNMTGADIATTVKNAHINALERAKIYESMEEGRFTPAMLEYFRITAEDFEKSIASFNNENSKKRNPIGFTKKV